MNKQEVIEKIKRCTEYFSDVNDYRRGFRDGLNHSLLVLRSLDEPEKPVVPKFVADWYEDHKHDFEYSLYDLCFKYTDRKLNVDLHKWFREEENKPFETLVMMNKFGYVIEEKSVKMNKPTVPQFVAIWYEDNQDDFEFNLYRLCVDYYNCDLDMEMMIWFRDKHNNPIQTLIAMHQLGYEVKKDEIKKDN